VGELILLEGVVRGPDCAPVPGALVEIWQACHSGRYDHPADPNTAPLDPAFQYWGRVSTDPQGEYRFKTIVPGAYPAAPGWIRPPHIHFRVSAAGFPPLVTQMYFEGQELNASDRILQQLDPAARAMLVVAFTPSDRAPGAKAGFFQIRLGSRGAKGATPYLK